MNFCLFIDNLKDFVVLYKLEIGVCMISRFPFVKNLLTNNVTRNSGVRVGDEILFQKTPSLKSLQKDTFCHKYWQQIKSEGLLKKSEQSSVKLHGYLNGINHHLITGVSPKNMDIEFMLLGLTPRDMITLTDVEFKSLKPTTKTIQVFRSIGEKPDFFSVYKLYKKRLDIKEGEIIDMKEYAYATSDINYAKDYLTNNKGILYDIEIPKGSRVSITGDNTATNEVVFPRSSKFVCVGKEHVKDANNDYAIIKLRYVVPQEV